MSTSLDEAVELLQKAQALMVKTASLDDADLRMVGYGRCVSHAAKALYLLRQVTDAMADRVALEQHGRKIIKAAATQVHRSVTAVLALERGYIEPPKTTVTPPMPTDEFQAAWGEFYAEQSQI